MEGDKTKRRASSEGIDPDLIAGWALRTAPPGLARAIANVCLAWLRTQDSAKQGVCNLPHEDRSLQRLKDWLTRWEANPSYPSLEAQPPLSKVVRQPPVPSARSRKAGGMPGEEASPSEELAEFEEVWGHPDDEAWYREAAKALRGAADPGKSEHGFVPCLQA